ncbi:hypothetical protein MMC21_001808 [Puttea exsequens]|nr:hypothetical protein [Puttea exsequens]
MPRILGPIQEAITGYAKLGEVNGKFMKPGLSDVQVKHVNEEAAGGDAVKQKVSSHSVPSRNSQDTDEQGLRRISPDSNVRCQAPECPVQVIHSIGRYFHNGQRAKDFKDLGLRGPDGLMVVSVRRAFNYTIPPPDVVEAYKKTSQRLASRAEQATIRKYQKHHLFKPTTHESVSSRPLEGLRKLQQTRALILPLEDNDQADNRGARKLAGTEFDLVDDAHDDPGLHEIGRYPSLKRKSRIRRLRPSDFESSDEETRVDDGSESPTRIETFYSIDDNTPLAVNDENADIWMNTYRTEFGTATVLRNMPDGGHLKSVQQNLREKFLNSIMSEYPSSSENLSMSSMSSTGSIRRIMLGEKSKDSITSNTPSEK